MKSARAVFVVFVLCCVCLTGCSGKHRFERKIDKSLEEIKFKRPKKTLYFANMIQNAVDFLDGKEELRSTLQTGMNALAVLEEIKMALM